MIAIDNILVSDEVVEAQFVCDLHKCKGGCCEDGDAGAPLESGEMKIIDENFHAIAAYLAPEGLEEIKEKGKFVYDKEFGWVTPTINGGICAYGFRDRQGIINAELKQHIMMVNWIGKNQSVVIYSLLKHFVPGNTPWLITNRGIHFVNRGVR